VAAPHDLDSALDRLDEALRLAGLEGLEPPGDVTALADLASAVYPYALPSQLRRFWERVDAERITVFAFPIVGSPAAAREHMRLLQDLGEPVPIVPPPIFLPVDYASHCYGVIELESAWAEGGMLFEWDFDDVRVVARSLADRIDLLAELLSEGHFERGEGFVSLDHRAEQEKRLERLVASELHPLYGDLREIPTALESWPAHWLAASGIDLRERRPLGATHTIAELVTAANDGPATGRIHAEVVRLVGSGAGTLVVVDDGSGTLDVWCPAGTSPWGPVHRSRFELEVTVEGPVGAMPDLDSPNAEITRHALAGDLGSAQEAAIAFSEQLQTHRAAAVATDIRPLD
jgi:hypothetical protein